MRSKKKQKKRPSRSQVGIALVPEGRRVFAPLTVDDNLALGAYTRSRSAQRACVKADLAFVFDLFPRLKDRRSQRAGSLSGGEQQMLAIGRALMSRRRLLLLDEPSMGLAPIVIHDIFAKIHSLNEIGVAILLAEQNARLALRNAQRGYVLDAGRIVANDSVTNLQSNEQLVRAYFGV